MPGRAEVASIPVQFPHRLRHPSSENRPAPVTTSSIRPPMIATFLAKFACCSAPRRRLGDLPVAVADQRRHDGEHDQRERRAARPAAEHQRKPAAEFDQCAEPAERHGKRHVAVHKARREGVHGGKLAEAALHIDRAHQHAAEEQEKVLPGGEVWSDGFHAGARFPKMPPPALATRRRGKKPTLRRPLVTARGPRLMRTPARKSEGGAGHRGPCRRQVYAVCANV